MFLQENMHTNSIIIPDMLHTTTEMYSVKGSHNVSVPKIKLPSNTCALQCHYQTLISL